METPLQRRERRAASAALQKRRLSLLAELDALNEQECERCKTAVTSSDYLCDCKAAVRKREIGDELSRYLDVRVKIDTAEEAEKVAKNLKAPEMTEERVVAMRKQGMTLERIAAEFGVSAPTVSYRLRKWNVEKVRQANPRQPASPVQKAAVPIEPPAKDVAPLERQAEPTEKDEEAVVAIIPNFREGAVACGSCGKEIQLWYNGGELDQATCCGVRYQTQHVRTDLIITRLANMTNH